MTHPWEPSSTSLVDIHQDAVIVDEHNIMIYAVTEETSSSTNAVQDLQNHSVNNAQPPKPPPMATCGIMLSFRLTVKISILVGEKS